MTIFKGALQSTISTYRCKPPNCWWVGWNIKGTGWRAPFHIDCWSGDRTGYAGAPETPFWSFDTNATYSNSNDGDFGHGCVYGEYGTGNRVWIVVRDSGGRTLQSNTLY